MKGRDLWTRPFGVVRVGALLLFFLSLPLVGAQTPPASGPTLSDRIRDGIRRFGSADASARERALREVVAIGGEAIPFLRSAFEKDSDAEVRLQAERALAEIPIVADMVFVPSGEFEAGSEWEGAVNPKRTERTGAFWIDRYEVTNHQYYEFVKATHSPRVPALWTGERYPRGTANYPVSFVSFQDACAYAAWCGKRLPTESEWEKSARGTDGRKYPWGSEFDPKRANLASGSGWRGPAPVGSFPGDVSPYGCLDMEGNVSEWVMADASLPRSDEVIARGGNFLLNHAEYAELASRYNRTDRREGGRIECGFRCVRDLRPDEKPPR